MKKIILIVSVLLTWSCEDVVDIDLTESPARLVIDAIVERQLSDNGEVLQDSALVNLSLTTPYFSGERNFVNSATIILTDLESNTVFELSNINNKGDYEILATDFKIQPNLDYKLTINYNNEVYESTEKMVFSNPFLLTKQKKNNNSFDENNIAVDIAFKDLKEEKSFYFLDLGDTNFLAISDDFYVNGGEISFTYFFDAETTLNNRFKLYGSTKKFDAYLEAVNQLSSGGSNGPFSTVRFKAKGNIVNKTNSENFPFGYFRVSEVYSKAITLLPNKDFKK